MFDRSSGVLLPIFSLPGPYGVGRFGPEALQFAEILAAAGFSWWQVLPFTPPGYGDSPYQCYSAYAGNPLFINPDELHQQGLVTPEELTAVVDIHDQSEIDYLRVDHLSEILLRQAFSRIDDRLKQKVSDYRERNRDWLDDYALYRAIKRRQQDKPWWDWNHEGLRQADPVALADVRELETAEIDYVCFVQYEFDRQWQNLKEAVNAMGIQLIGDIPIYVAGDSADVWAQKKYFEMDAAGRFTRVAGVPPDYFTADGQLWGNPLYNWQVMADESYAWWIKRIRAGLTTFDVLRIDHFRGFESYWAIPAGEATARNGIWVKGPAMQLFERLLEVFPDAPIIAEDLGIITDDVREFLEQTGLPGMKVMQFTLNPSDERGDRPHNFPVNCVAYTGTHDNNTLVGWLKKLNRKELQMVRDYCGLGDSEAERRSYCRVEDSVQAASSDTLPLLGIDIDQPREGDFLPDQDDRVSSVDEGRIEIGGIEEGIIPKHLIQPACRAVIRCLWQTSVNLVIAPVQDLLGQDGRARINTPGCSSGCWTYRLSEHDLAALDIDRLRNLNRIFQRSRIRQANPAADSLSSILPV